MEILVADQQKDLKISKKAVKAFVLAALQFLEVACDEVHINFVTEKKICLLHQQFFNDPSPTDCITLPLDDSDVPGYKLLGEVFICPKAALSYPDPYKETALYVVHTLLHLIGYTDTKPTQRLKMRAAERKVLRHLDKNNLHLYTNLV